MLTDEHEHAMKVAKVIAKAMGDNFSDAFKNKQRWTAKRGMSGGRFRDVNEPFQDDYIAAAQAAAALIAADRAGLVARIAELKSEVEVLSDNGCHLDALCKQQEAENARLRETGAFLLGRLDELEWHDGQLDETARQYFGHVGPAVYRFRAALGARNDADA